MRFPGAWNATVRFGPETADDVRMMKSTHSSSGQVGSLPSPRDTFLTLPEVAARYRWGRTKTFEMRCSPDFPPAIGGVYRLDTLQAWEDHLLTAGRDPSRATPAPRPKPSVDVPMPPSRKRSGPRRGAQEPTQ